MRWEALFEDLEGQLERADRAEMDAEAAELARGLWSRTALADRLRAGTGLRVRLLLTGGGWVAGTCADVAPEWVLLDGDRRDQVLVPLAAVAAVGGLTRQVAPPAGEVLRRLGLGSALRALARGRTGVQVDTTGGTLSGTIDRVGADHFDLAEHPTGEPRRASAVRAVLTVPFPALRAVRSAAG